MRTKRRVIASIAATGVLIGTLAIAQSRGTAGSDATTPAMSQRGPQFGGTFHGMRGGRRGPAGTLPFGRGPALGTTVQVRLYDTQPEDGVEPTRTLELTVGEDSEVAFMQELVEAREGAAYMVIATSEQTRTIDLPDASDATAGTLEARRAPHLGFDVPLAGLEEGDTVTATFYDGDPAEGGEELQELSFTYGESSAIGFRTELTEAAEEADFVVVTTPPQERVVDPSAAPSRLDTGRGFGPKPDFDRGAGPEPGFGRGFGRR